MAFLKIENVAIKGISACVPPQVEHNKDLPFYAPGEAEQVIEATGIERRHIATSDICVSDLSFRAAEKLIDELGWDYESIDLLALCTQNPDYHNHPTSFLVHERLGLKEHTMCMDFFHGCPGWVISLSGIASIVSGGIIKRAILLVGDTVTKDQNRASRETWPLFGDCCTATAIEYTPGAPAMYFNNGTQSDGGKALILTQGGYRNPYTHETLDIELARRAGTLTEGQSDQMDGMDVFSFAITKVPKALKRLCAEYNIDIDSVDNVVLHQANKMIVDAIAKRLKVSNNRVPLSLREYGNTTSASIPLTIVSSCKEKFSKGIQHSLVCGFGNGLSWGSAYFVTDSIVLPDVIVY